MKTDQTMQETKCHIKEEWDNNQLKKVLEDSWEQAKTMCKMMRSRKCPACLNRVK